ncbi:alpha/beta hydrolase [Microvirga flavescens]|uniref:alpha/beta hydrolase n=1 Tax=Microvirga flavescens TaxID=2249811 RepID=UPI0018E0B0AB|nr:alpha/beta hydrolase [Microvirga flavescens]
MKWMAWSLILIALTLFGVRAYDSQRGAPLAPWHTFVPEELGKEDLDHADWAAYLKAEQSIFDSVRSEVTQKLDPQERIADNRYFDGSPVHPGRFAKDWNRSFILEPEGAPRGAVVLLHGLTDAPYSLRHVARLYREHGFVSVGIRLPAHGTVPGALTDVEWEDWLAATRLAVREARRNIGPSKPLHIVGYSNGGALTLKYALDALDDDRLTRADRLVLISPMVGVTAFARFAGLAGLPAYFPRFAKAAWLSVLPEFNPFKYNSFPVNAARQSYLLTAALQERLSAKAKEGRLRELPPILTFQSVMDFTVSTRAVVSALYDLLPVNDNEIVLFDLNRAADLGPLLSPSAETALSRILPPAPRRYGTIVVTNAGPGDTNAVAQITPAGATETSVHPLGLAYPRDIYSLSHVALPFPVDDSLYGLAPEGDADFGLHLGTLAARGERGVLVSDLDTLMRINSNPFYPQMAARIAQTIAADLARKNAP